MKNAKIRFTNLLHYKVQKRISISGCTIQFIFISKLNMLDKNNYLCSRTIKILSNPKSIDTEMTHLPLIRFNHVLLFNRFTITNESFLAKHQAQLAESTTIFNICKSMIWEKIPKK